METIRREWDEQRRKWYFSMVDIIAWTTKSSDPRNYWKVLKNRLKRTHNELVTACNQLKMAANDGKFYLTDAADEETALQIIKLVAPEKALHMSEWFENLDRQKNITGYGPTPRDNEGEGELVLMIDAYREKDAIIIMAFVAGVDMEKLLVSATPSTVTIRGERKVDRNTHKEHAQELAWGKFSRVLTLPEEIEIDQASASGEHGLLTIKLPLINKNRSRLLKVRSV